MKKLIIAWCTVLTVTLTHPAPITIDNQTKEPGWRVRFHRHGVHHQLFAGKNSYDITIPRVELVKWLGQGGRVVCIADQIGTGPYTFFKTNGSYQLKDHTNKLVTCKRMVYGPYAHDWQRKFNKAPKRRA